MIPNPTIIAYAVAGWLLSLILVGAGIGYWQHEAGETAANEKWEKRENKELTDANAEIARIAELNKLIGAEHAESVNAAAKKLNDARINAEARRVRDVRAALDGSSVGLRIPSAICKTYTDAASGAGTSTPGSDAEKTVRLPRQIEADLLELGYDANATADALRAAQEIIVADRKACSL